MRCRRLADGMGNPDDALNLRTFGTEYDAQADAADAAQTSPTPPAS